MTVVFSPRAAGCQPIFISRPEEKIDPDTLARQLADLSRRRRITLRDERLLEHLLVTGVLSLNQVHRLLWPQARPKTAADRLSKLWQWQLLRRARPPWFRLPALGLPAEPVFGLGAGGWGWLTEAEPTAYPYRLIDADWVWRHLAAAEVYSRLAVNQPDLEWRARWRGLPELYQPADPTAVVTLRSSAGQPCPIALELVVVETIEMPAKFTRYDELAGRGQPVTVAMVIAQAAKVEQLAGNIRQRRRQPVTYLLAGWDHLLAAPSLLTTPCWLKLGWQTAPRRMALAEALDG